MMPCNSALTMKPCAALSALFAGLVLVLSVSRSDAATACSKGDLPCFCKAVGGVYKQLKAPLQPGCNIPYLHQGRERYVRVFFPAAYDGTDKWPLWVHLHGVFWTTMGDIAARVGQPVNGTDIIPVWDKTVELLGDKAILAYPQSTGDPGTGDEEVDGQGDKYRQFWNIPFWRCSVGICSDPTVNDVTFIEKVVRDLPKRLRSKPGVVFLTGESAGGMLVNTLMCQSPSITSSISAAVDMLGGLGQEYVDSGGCNNPNQVPYLKLHGMTDPFITYNKQILVDGVNFLSAKEAVQAIAKEHGCTPEPDATFKPAAGGDLQCTDYCAGTPRAAPAELCGIVGVAHTTDFPHPGFVYEQAWKFFERAGVKVRKSPAAAAGSAGPVKVNLTFSDVDVAQFRNGYSPQVAEALSTVTDVPMENITVSFLPLGRAAAPAVAPSAASATGARTEATAAVVAPGATYPAAAATTAAAAVPSTAVAADATTIGNGLSAAAVSTEATAADTAAVAPAENDAPAAAGPAPGSATDVFAAADTPVEAAGAESSSSAAAPGPVVTLGHRRLLQLIGNTMAAGSATGIAGAPSAVFLPSDPPTTAAAVPATAAAPAAAATSTASAPAGLVAMYTLNAEDATAAARSLNQAATSGALTGLLAEQGVVSAKGTTSAGQLQPLALPTMSIGTGTGAAAVSEAVQLSPVALTADTPQPNSDQAAGSSSREADGAAGDSSEGGVDSSSGSNPPTRKVGGLPVWTIIVIAVALGVGLLLGVSALCICCCIRRKRRQDQEVEAQFADKLRQRRQRQQLEKSSPEESGGFATPRGEAADVDVVVDEPNEEPLLAAQ